MVKAITIEEKVESSNLEKKVEDIKFEGYLDTFFEVDPNTIQTAAEVMIDQRNGLCYSFNGYFTANYALYTMEGNQAVLYFGGRENNPVLTHYEDVVRQGLRGENFELPTFDAEEAKNSAFSLKIRDAQRINLKDLKLWHLYRKEEHVNHSESFGDFGYFEIDTTYYGGLNPAQRALAEAVYGNNGLHDFEATMAWMAEQGVKQTKIYVLMPGYVKQHASEKPIIRDCWLDNKFNDYEFAQDIAGTHDLNWFAMRGARKSE